MDFIITDRAGIERGIPVQTSYVVISIHDPEEPPAQIRQQPGLPTKLVLAFDHAESIPSNALPGEIALRTREQCGESSICIEKQREKVSAGGVHREMGMSRSPGIGAALCRTFGEDDQFFWEKDHPNRHVARLVLAVFKCTGRHESGRLGR